MSNFNRRLGWLPDYPDFRDYSANHQNVLRAVNGSLLEVLCPKLTVLPAKADLTDWCSPIEDQGDLGSCTAHAAAGMLEYFERRAFGKHLDVSRLFIYKTTRNLMSVTGDTGAFLRSTMGALVLFGAPPEEYWKYRPADFDKEPSAFCYSFAQNYQAIVYYRLDTPDVNTQGLLERIKTNLAAGLPSMFGFTVYDSVAQANLTGKIPYPGAGENVLGGHAIMAVGYNDGLVIQNGKQKTTGALYIRNSWGKDWGEKGYGWLPYEYVLQGLALDWWSLIKSEWVDTGMFRE